MTEQYIDTFIQKYAGGAGNANIAAPANPVTNISGGALGYFSAQTVSSKTVIAP